MMTDPIADMLTRIRNALLMKKEQVTIPYSKMKEALAKILQQEGYLAGVETAGEKLHRALVLQLRYLPDGKAAITSLRRISKPSRRVYCGYQELKPFRGGLGCQILSTPKGIFSDTLARKQKVGGEILLEVW